MCDDGWIAQNCWLLASAVAAASAAAPYCVIIICDDRHVWTTFFEYMWTNVYTRCNVMHSFKFIFDGLAFWCVQSHRRPWRPPSSVPYTIRHTKHHTHTRTFNYTHTRAHTRYRSAQHDEARRERRGIYKYTHILISVSNTHKHTHSPKSHIVIASSTHVLHTVTYITTIGGGQADSTNKLVRVLLFRSTHITAIACTNTSHIFVLSHKHKHKHTHAGT